MHPNLKKKNPANTDNYSTSEIQLTKKRTFEQYKMVKPRSAYTRMEWGLVRALSYEKYEEITCYIKRHYSAYELQDFLYHEGMSVFNSVLSASDKVTALSFMIHLAGDLSVPILKEDNFSIIDEWLRALRYLESCNHLANYLKIESVEKIKILYALKDDAITEFINKSVPDSMKKMLKMIK